ncbi:MAG: histidine kinase, partial [Sediminibacterium sp.]|nr:histidine kinase [Sediminibacterium sp.]
VNGQGIVKLVPPLYDRFIIQSIPVEGFFIKKINATKFLYGLDSKNKNVPEQTDFVFLDVDNTTIITPVSFEHNRASLSRHSAVQIDRDVYLFSIGGKIYTIRKGQAFLSPHLYSARYAQIVHLFKDLQNKVWLSDDKADGEIEMFNPEVEFTGGYLKNEVPSCTFEDSEKGYWFTTTTNGLYYMPNLHSSYFDKTIGLTANKVHAMSLLNHKLYCFTSDKKMNVIDLKTNRVTSNSTILSTYLFGYNNELIINSNVYSADNLSVKTSLAVMDSSDGKKIVFKRLIEYDETYLIGFTSGSKLIKLNKYTRKCTLLSQIPARCFAIHKVNERIYIGTKQGVFIYENGHLSDYGEKVPRLNTRIEGICSYQGQVFFATKDLGVFCVEDGKVVQQITETDGLASNICKCIANDSGGTIWIGTNRGLSTLYKSKTESLYRCKTLDLSSGMVSNEVNQILFYENKLIFASNNGVGILEPSGTFNSRAGIPVYIEAFSVNAQKLDANKVHQLRYNQNFISIAYKGIYLKNEGNLTYKYRLEGLDTNWTVTKNTFVQYTTLPAGDYKFSVFVVDGNKDTQPLMATVSFRIRPPYWKNWWFISGIIVLTGSSIYVLYKQRVRRIREKESQKAAFSKQLLESELKALRAQMNPHFMFNAVNSIQSFILQNDSETAQKYLTKFSRLIRSVLENSKMDSILLSREIDTLKLYLDLECLRASFRFEYEIHVEEILQPDVMQLPPMLIQPYVENAVLHGLLPLANRRGKLLISFYREKDLIFCKIEDNGIGRKAAQEIKRKKEAEHRSFGMEIASDRIEKLNFVKGRNYTVSVIDKLDDTGETGVIVIIALNV